MDEIDFSNSKFKDLRCQYDPKDNHVFKDPVKLPCGKTFCLDCIKKFVGEKKNCKCDALHNDLELDKLEIDQEISKKVNENSTAITEEIINKLLEFAESMKGTHEEREKKIKELCDRVRDEIHKRVSDIKAHLDNLHKELKTQLQEIKAKVYEELKKLNEDVETKTKQYKEFAGKMEEMLKNFDQNKEQLQKDIYTCQDHIEELKRLDENFHKILRKVSFEPSDWTPDASYIGTFTCPELLESDGEEEEEEEEEENEEREDIADN